MSVIYKQKSEKNQTLYSHADMRRSISTKFCIMIEDLNAIILRPNFLDLISSNLGHRKFGWKCPTDVITGRICRRQLCRYFVYSRADFGVFRPTGATRYTDQGQIWRGGADNILPAKFDLDRFRGGGCKTEKIRILPI